MEQEIDSPKVYQKIVELYSSPEYARLVQLYQVVPFMEAIHKHRNETAYSSFLCWLFNQPELQRQPIQPALSLLRLLALRRDDNTQMSNTLWRSILTNGISIKKVQAATETATKSDKGNGRADIELLIDFNLMGDSADLHTIRIVIENKIDTAEHDDQCKKYFRHFTKLNDVEENIYTFLAPNAVSSLSDPHFIQITYQDLLNHVIAPTVAVPETLPKRIVNYIDNFIETITSIRQNRGKYTQIAMDKELQELLTEFYNNNEDIIMAAISAAAPEEVKEKMQEAKRDYTSYAITYIVDGIQKQKIVNAKSQLAKKFVEAYLEINNNTSMSQMNDILRDVKAGLITDHNDSRTAKIEGRDWYIQSGIWGKGSKYFENLKLLIEKTQNFELSEI